MLLGIGLVLKQHFPVDKNGVSLYDNVNVM